MRTVVRLLAEQGKPGEIAGIMESNQYVDPVFMRTMMGRAYRTLGERDTARQVLVGILEENPSYRGALDELMALNVQERSVNGMLDALNAWLAHNPQDAEIRKVLDDLQAQLAQYKDTPAGVRTTP